LSHCHMMLPPGNENVPIGCTAIKPVERHGFDAIKWFLYDKNTGAIMGRTPKSWFLITIFYIIYYTCLAAFWLVCLLVFFNFVDVNEPTWQQDESLIGRSPALGVRPGQHESKIESSIITFNFQNQKDELAVPGYKGWVDRADKFLEPYGVETKKAINCNYPGDANIEKNEFCKFNLENIGDCAKGNYGFDSNSPCLILKLNKIFGLVPEIYDGFDFPEEMPSELLARIANASDKNKIWVSCSGEYPADKEAIQSFEYFPSDGGFSAMYFPYKNQKDYQSPLVAVKLHNVTVGQLVHVECRAWARNIKYDRRDRIGIVHFEMVVHNEKSANQVNYNKKY